MPIARIFCSLSLIFAGCFVAAAADDYKSDPTGNAGDRIACGVIAE